ncbi:hypothetical protein ADUPG1_000408 [Aduncisulcus paluster]|uniref:Uncharacterized protein n=1 Tax=Aduncisulcus paluster TaxID=2918883 RepID=A0ABQ5K680_9EUKA|nr:hypothetical protein ADUPG1_000408 [Aduncisulcus paluster]
MTETLSRDVYQIEIDEHLFIREPSGNSFGFTHVGIIPEIQKDPVQMLFLLCGYSNRTELEHPMVKKVVVEMLKFVEKCQADKYPNIIPVLGVVEAKITSKTGKKPYYALGLIKYESVGFLIDVIAAWKRIGDYEVCVKALQQAAICLFDFHQQDIIHGFIGPRSFVVVEEFGGKKEFSKYFHDARHEEPSDTFCLSSRESEVVSSSEDDGPTSTCPFFYVCLGDYFPSALRHSIIQLQIFSTLGPNTPRLVPNAIMDPLAVTVFSSPEQLRGEIASKRSDVYSFGILTFVAATGHLPHQYNPAVKSLIGAVSQEGIQRDYVHHLFRYAHPATIDLQQQSLFAEIGKNSSQLATSSSLGPLVAGESTRTGSHKTLHTGGDGTPPLEKPDQVSIGKGMEETDLTDDAHPQPGRTLQGSLDVPTLNIKTIASKIDDPPICSSGCSASRSLADSGRIGQSPFPVSYMSLTSPTMSSLFSALSFFVLTMSSSNHFPRLHISSYHSPLVPALARIYSSTVKHFPQNRVSTETCVGMFTMTDDASPRVRRAENSSSPRGNSRRGAVHEMKRISSSGSLQRIKVKAISSEHSEGDVTDISNTLNDVTPSVMTPVEPTGQVVTPFSTPETPSTHPHRGSCSSNSNPDLSDEGTSDALKHRSTVDKGDNQQMPDGKVESTSRVDASLDPTLVKGVELQVDSASVNHDREETSAIVTPALVDEPREFISYESEDSDNDGDSADIRVISVDTDGQQGDGSAQVSLVKDKDDDLTIDIPGDETNISSPKKDTAIHPEHPFDQQYQDGDDHKDDALLHPAEGSIDISIEDRDDMHAEMQFSDSGEEEEVEEDAEEEVEETLMERAQKHWAFLSTKPIHSSLHRGERRIDDQACVMFNSTIYVVGENVGLSAGLLGQDEYEEEEEEEEDEYTESSDITEKARRFSIYRSSISDDLCKHQFKPILQPDGDDDDITSSTTHFSQSCAENRFFVSKFLAPSSKLKKAVPSRCSVTNSTESFIFSGLDSGHILMYPNTPSYSTVLSHLTAQIVMAYATQDEGVKKLACPMFKSKSCHVDANNFKSADIFSMAFPLAPYLSVPVNYFSKTLPTLDPGISAAELLSHAIYKSYSHTGFFPRPSFFKPIGRNRVSRYAITSMDESAGVLAIGDSHGVVNVYGLDYKGKSGSTGDVAGMTSGSSSSASEEGDLLSPYDMVEKEKITSQYNYAMFREKISASEDRETIGIIQKNSIAPTMIKLSQVIHTSTVYDLFLGLNFLVTCSKDGVVRGYNRTDWEQSMEFCGHKKAVLCCDHYRNLLISGSADHKCMLWDVTRQGMGGDTDSNNGAALSHTSEHTRSILSKHEARVRDVCFGKDGSLVAAAIGDGTISIRDVRRSVKDPLFNESVHSKSSSGVGFGSNFLFTSGYDGHVCVFDLRSAATPISKVKVTPNQICSMKLKGRRVYCTDTDGALSLLEWA